MSKKSTSATVKKSSSRFSTIPRPTEDAFEKGVCKVTQLFAGHVYETFDAMRGEIFDVDPSEQRATLASLIENQYTIGRELTYTPGGGRNAIPEIGGLFAEHISIALETHVNGSESIVLLLKGLSLQGIVVTHSVVEKYFPRTQRWIKDWESGNEPIFAEIYTPANGVQKAMLRALFDRIEAWYVNADMIAGVLHRRFIESSGVSLTDVSEALYLHLYHVLLQGAWLLETDAERKTTRSDPFVEALRARAVGLEHMLAVGELVGRNVLAGIIDAQLRGPAQQTFETEVVASAAKVAATKKKKTLSSAAQPAKKSSAVSSVKSKSYARGSPYMAGGGGYGNRIGAKKSESSSSSSSSSKKSGSSSSSSSSKKSGSSSSSSSSGSASPRRMRTAPRGRWAAAGLGYAAGRSSSKAKPAAPAKTTKPTKQAKSTKTARK